MGNLCSIEISTEDATSCCLGCIVRHANYTCKLEKNVRALSVALEELKALKDDVHRRVDCAEQQHMIKRLSQVQFWLSRAETMMKEAEELIKDSSKETQKLCLAGYFSKNCRSSYKFGRKVTKKIKEIVELKSKGVFGKVAENEPTAPVHVRPTEPTVGLESTMAKVSSLLKGKQFGMIGLYGLGGVGKTTLLTQINNWLSSAEFDFDVVIWVVVSKDHRVENVQENIGKRIGLLNELENKSCDEKAVDIFRILSKKKFVLLLDDVWERVHLTQIGVPLPSQENGSKVVFTTRFLEICNEMEAQEIKVECLRANEAWKLFKEKVGEETLNSHSDIPELAKRVSEKCGGLPLALITIGRAMASKKTPQAWEYAVETLKKSAHKLARMGQDVYPLLKFSYDSLHSDTIRSCLLYCCLYPEDVLILKSELIEYWFCEGLLDEFDCISRARLQGYSIIDSLLNACLLEEDGEYYVKMHDVIRDMTLWIACESEAAAEKSFFVQAGLQLIETPDVGKWENVRRISLIGNKIKDLTATPSCPNLQTLLLNYNELQVISNGFFKSMPNLRVLNLAGNRGLRDLPEGISELVSLECLNLSRTGIRELPTKLKSLANLKYLDLRYTEILTRIPRKLISSFSKLQIFRMFRCGTGDYYPNEMDDNEDVIVELGCLQVQHLNGFRNPYETDGDNVLNEGNEGLNLIEELGCLQYLNMLSIHIRSALHLERFLSFPNLQGCTQELSLCVLKETKLLNVSSLANMERLERLDVSECGNLEEMKIVTEELGEGGRRRRRMLQTSLFPTLREVTIFECSNLRDMTWIILVPNLRFLWVVNCAKIEEIMSEVAVADMVKNLKPSPFSMLQNLSLQFLPELKSIYWDVLPFPCLTEIFVRECPKLRDLPVNSDSAKGNQICIQGEKEWWERLEWKDKATQNAFLPFFEPL